MEKLANSDFLKAHTQEVHVQLEQMLIPIIQSISTLEQYASLLKIFYSFYAPAEDQLSKVPYIERYISGVDLRKADSLKRDIIALGESTVNMRLCSELPACIDLSDAFGIMYVLEGSVLGGKAIATIITRCLPANSAIPFSFFLHYNGNAKIKWQQFKTHLDNTDGLLQPQLLTAATNTFVLFKDWIKKNVPSDQ
jgi:heme oxygenase